MIPALADGAVLRSNPAYELVPLERLETPELDAIEPDAGTAPGAYGLLRPRAETAMDPRMASADTALLFLTLQTPGPCPSYVRAGLGERTNGVLARLVMDGILEVEIDGAFQSGPAALPVHPTTALAGSRGHSAELSREALEYADHLGRAPVEALALRLYMYGRAPVTPELRRRLPDEDAVRDFLGLAGDGQAPRVLERGWVEGRPSEERAVWRSWHRQSRTNRPARDRPVGGPTWKLYVSPTIDALPDAFEGAVAALDRAPGTTGMKVGRRLPDLVRPDKLVAYFARVDDLLEAARHVEAEIDGSQPQGVPFAADVSRTGLLSWGVDPPRQGSGRDPGASWRTWVTSRLADYLADVQKADVPAPRWPAALERLRLDGVDVDTWVPNAALFDSPAARGFAR